jgi:hypothetical protein
MTRENIDERLERISRELDELLAKAGKSDQGHPVENKRVILTKEQRKSWLKQEAGFPKPIVRPLSDDSYHPSSSDEDVTEPLKVMHL